MLCNTKTASIPLSFSLLQKAISALLQKSESKKSHHSVKLRTIYLHISKKSSTFAADFNFITL